jgi:hypothetical protein
MSITFHDGKILTEIWSKIEVLISKLYESIELAETQDGLLTAASARPPGAGKSHRDSPTEFPLHGSACLASACEEEHCVGRR